MSFDYHYYYLSGSFYFLIIWLIIFIKLRRYRFQMIVLGSALWIGIAAEYFWWTKDWWHPTTITGTLIGIEDFIMSFTHVGIPMFIYMFVFSRETEKNHLPKSELFLKMMKNFSMWFTVSFIPTAVLIFFLDIHSFIATVIGMIFGSLFIILKRKDLIIPMTWSALLMTTISLPAYWLAYFFPGVIDNTWNFVNISGFMLIGVPVEDIIWYALLGFLLGGAYEFLFEFNLEKKILSKQINGLLK